MSVIHEMLNNVEFLSQVLSELKEERKMLMQTVGTLAAENTELKKQLETLTVTPRRLQVGDRVVVCQNSGFSVGAHGTVMFVEPNNLKVWVLRDHAQAPCWFKACELALEGSE